MDNVFTSQGYNSYFENLDEANDAVGKLAGFYNLTKWNALSRTVAISSIVVNDENVGGEALVTTPSAHKFSSNQLIRIKDSTEEDLNGYYLITVVSNTTFTFSTSAVANGTYDDFGANAIYEQSEIKENLMFAATDDFNSFEFKGGLNGAVISPFNMKFPRSGLTYQNGVAIPENENPVFISQYIAMRIVERLANVESGVFDLGKVRSRTIGKLRQEFFSPNEYKIFSKSMSKHPSYNAIKPYVSGFSGGISKYVVRG